MHFDKNDDIMNMNGITHMSLYKKTVFEKMVLYVKFVNKSNMTNYE